MAERPNTHDDSRRIQEDSQTAQGTQMILVVDDEPMVREFAQRLLEIEGHQVIQAGSGAEALSLLRAPEANFRGVLLDLSMPGMDGAAVLGELRNFAPDIPVIVQSGFPGDATSERLRSLGVSGVLQKPYRAAQLCEMVRTVFGSGS